jgi:hypothetical protein
MPANPSEPLARPRGRALFIPLLLFLATCGTVLWTGATLVLQREPSSLGELLTGWVYAIPLMGILTCHEFGHYIAARRHGVAASLPYFLPLYKLSPFGTLGAVITMPPIRSRNALLDIGAAAPPARARDPHTVPGWLPRALPMAPQPRCRAARCGYEWEAW